MIKEKIFNREKTKKRKNMYRRNSMNQLIKDYSNDEEIIQKIESYIKSLNVAN